MEEIAYPPGGFPREDSDTTHTDSDGSWIYILADNIWKGQNGSENYPNAIQLNEVQISSPKYEGFYLDTLMVSRRESTDLRQIQHYLNCMLKLVRMDLM